MVSAPRQTATVHQLPRSARPTGRVRRGMVRYALGLADLAGLVTALAGAYFLTSGGTTLDPLLIVLPAWAVLAGFYGLYRRDRVGADNATLDEVWPIFHCVTVASWTVFAIVQVLSPTALHGGRVIAFWAVASVAIPAYRSLSRSVLRRQLALKQNAVVVGAGLVGQEIARKIRRSPNYGLDLVGFVDQNPLPLHDELADVPVLGSTNELGMILQTHDIDHVVLAFTADHEAGLDVVRVCNELGVQVDIVPRLFEVVGSRAGVYSLEGTPLLGLTPPRAGRVAPAREADDGRRRRDLRAGRAVADLPGNGDRDPREQHRPGVLPPDPHRRAASSRSRSSSSARWCATPRPAKPRSPT